jgi:acetolactate synthase-1/3 small subunit
MEHIILVTVENKFGVLSRIAGLFSGRGFNIESLSVAPTLDPSMSQMTIVTSGDERIVEQIVKQLNKLIDVIKVVDLNESDFVSRETALIKVHTRQEDRAEALPISSARMSSIRLPRLIRLKSRVIRKRSKRSSISFSRWESKN